jgi:AmmeMemoRadiSam system protein A
LRLARLAREAIRRALGGNHAAGGGATGEPRGVFVTLRRREGGELRGCIGIPEARHPLDEALCRAAVSAALSDPRFPPVSLDELPALAVQVSVLTPLVPGRAEDVVIGRHGVSIRGRGRSGLFLPQVAVEQGWDVETLLAQLCRKAGLPADAWKDAGCQLLLFETESDTDEREERR